jgi:hypothetical protein
MYKVMLCFKDTSCVCKKYIKLCVLVVRRGILFMQPRVLREKLCGLCGKLCNLYYFNKALTFPIISKENILLSCCIKL